MSLYRLAASFGMLAASVVTDAATTGDFFDLYFEPHNIFDENIAVRAQISQISDDFDLESLKLKITFFDDTTDDELYSFVGGLGDASKSNSLVAVMEASQEFADVQLKLNIQPDADLKTSLVNCPYFNGLNELGRKVTIVPLPAGSTTQKFDLFETITELDNPPTTLYMQFYDNVKDYTDMLRAVAKLNCRMWVELDPTLTVDQAIQVAEDLLPMDHRVRFLWSPIVARPKGAVGLSGKKVPRLAGGFVIAKHMLRDAATNSQGIPPLHRPIANYDYPIPFIGIEQRNDVKLTDPVRKRLANACINVVQRIKFDTGIRFVIGDVLTAEGDNNSILKLTNASDISMYIDNRLKQIVKRHLTKSDEDFLGDALKECKRFMDACTTKERKLLVQPEEFSGLYQLSIVPRQDRPDAVDIKARYRPHGAKRAAFFNSEVVK